MKITSVEQCILHLPVTGAGTTPTPLAWDNYRRATT